MSGSVSSQKQIETPNLNETKNIPTKSEIQQTKGENPNKENEFEQIEVLEQEGPNIERENGEDAVYGKQLDRVKMLYE